MEEILAKVPGRDSAEHSRTTGVSRQCVHIWLTEQGRQNNMSAMRLAELTGHSEDAIRGR
jgi:hypothetical protein